jgi:Lysozyme like domain
LNVNDISEIAAQAGFSGSDINVAAAIAMAESSGDPGNVGDRDLAPENGPSYGLWQINVGTKAHPEFASWNLLDPATNAAAAFRIYSRAGGSFHEWTTYTKGQFAKYLPASAAPVTIDAGTGAPIMPPIAPTAIADLTDIVTAGSGGVWPTILIVALGLVGLWIVEESF